MSDMKERLAEHEKALSSADEEGEESPTAVDPDDSLKMPGGGIEDEKLDELMEMEQNKEDIENIKDRVASYDANDLRKRALQLKKVVDLSYLEFGAILWNVKNFEAYVEWGYETFAEYVNNELDFRERKAHYLSSIWDKIKELDINPADLEGVPWSKMAVVSSVMDHGNYEEWLTKARELSRPELKQEVKEERTGEEQEESHRLQFTLMGDQYDNVEEALDVAEDIAQSDKQGHLLDLICTEFLASNLGETSQDLQWVIGHVARNFDVNIIAADDSTFEEIKQEYSSVEGASK